MAFHSLKDLYVDELRDLYDAEKQVISAMPKMITHSSSPDVRQAFQHHLDETRIQVERLDLIFKNLGVDPKGRRCKGMEGILAEADEIIGKGGAPDVSDAALISAAQRVEHYEIASYGSARTFADRLDDGYAADLLQKTLDEEGRTDKALTSLAETGINQKAAEGKEIRGSNLDYVNVNQYQYGGGRDSFSDVRMFGAGGDDLGTLDGFVVDRNTGRPYYLVVEAGNWFVGKRYLVPVGKAHFEPDSRRMRLDIGKDTVKKYPKFEENWFEFDEARRREYEGSLLTAFGASPAPGTAGGFDYGSMPEFSQPEWWRAGDYGVVPGERDREPGAGRRAAEPIERVGERTAARERRPDLDRPGSDRRDIPGEGRSTIDEPPIRDDRDPNKRRF